MLIAFEGSMGSGKTLGATIWAWLYSYELNTNVLSNVALRPEWFGRHRRRNIDFDNSQLLCANDFVALAQRGGGIILFDEIHQNLDSRAWASRNARYWTQFMMYLRKMNSPMFCTSQSVAHQLDVRIRQVLDVIVTCRKTKAGFQYHLRDAKTDAHICRRFIPYQLARLFYGVYNTKKIIRPIAFPSTERGYIDFLDALEQAVIAADTRALPPVPEIFLLPGVTTNDAPRSASVSLSWD